MIHTLPHSHLMKSDVIIVVFTKTKFKSSACALSVTHVMDENDSTGGVKSFYNLMHIKSSFSALLMLFLFD